MKPFNDIQAFQEWSRNLDTNQTLEQYPMQITLEWWGDPAIQEEIICFRKIGGVEFKIIAKILFSSREGKHIKATYLVEIQ
jgi:hypothetical protein